MLFVVALTGATTKSKDHRRAASELRAALARHPDAAAAEKALRELVAMKGDVEYGTSLPSLRQAQTAVRRARSLVDLARTVISGT